MNFLKFEHVFLLLALCALILMIPQSFAIDNETAADFNSTDYYFNVNADSDGNGSIDNPYKNFTDERIKENSNVHLATGEYVFEKSRIFSNITFAGVNPQNTIINGNFTKLTISGDVNFRNVTLKNFQFINEGNLNAVNTFFINSLPVHLQDDTVNYYGGGIFAELNKNIYLENCSFINNSAPYGGAIYAKGGNLTIINSLFYNTTAYYMGGAILGESGVRIIINNTKFILAKSVDDAGGAIYIVSSSLRASNSTITNCSGSFGAGILSLKSDLDLYNLTFWGNAAKYDGGAVYQYYGSLNLNSSNFISNTARNGAGLFTNDVDVLNITHNEFVYGSASNYGGAIYSFLKNNFSYEDNLFENNNAYLFDDVYLTSKVNLTISNGDYRLYVLNQTSNTTIPEIYDLRELGYLTPVKDQVRGGNCWAFAAIAALESCILKASGEVLDLSEENMKNLMAWYSDYGRNIRNPNDGGDNDMPIAYLVSWLGPVSENDDSYDDKSQLSPVLNSLMHVQNVIFLKRDNYTDNDAIKQAVMNYGAVATTMYYGANLTWEVGGRKICYYYADESTPTNHAVTIVGWDDSVKVSGAPAPGAWIVRNSWGSNWLGGASYANHDGYFYVSYYDKVFARPGDYASYTFILNDTKHFDKNYQYDISGVTDYFYLHQNTLWYKNAFNATDNEFLAAVSTYFNKNTSWELYIYVNSKLQLIQNGSSIPGYYTINLDYPVPLVKGDIFEILFKITTAGDVGFPISESMSVTKMSFSPGISFVSFNGENYFDLYDFSHEYPGHFYFNQVACIKGFTQSITLNCALDKLDIVRDGLDLFNITINLKDENNNSVRNGEVIFTVNGINHTVSMYDGIGFLQIPFSLGINNISWSFSSPNYYSCSDNTTYEVLPIKLTFNITVNQQFNNAVVSFIFSQNITENLTVSLNGVNRTVETINGFSSIDLFDLEYGEYNISAFIDNKFYDGRNSTNFFINVKKTYIDCMNLTTVYNSSVSYSIRLYDQFNQSVAGRKVKFAIGEHIYYNTTDENGRAFISLNLITGVYSVLISFEVDELYIQSQNSSVITVKSSISPPDNIKYAFNSNYEVYLLDKNGNPLNNTLVKLIFDNENYNVRSDDDGKVSFKIPANSGDFTIELINPETLQKFGQKITVIKRITQNNDISVYFGNTPDFKVRVCDDKGEYKAGLKVKLTVNGKIFELNTDQNGWASLKINLKIGKYTVISEYNGYKVSNKITVKPTLITKNKKFKKGKIVKYSAKLLNKNGKPLKNKKITFKVKGKTYKAKTNKNGVAKVKIKNLKVGKYKIIIKYAKITNKNIITVKK